MAKINAVKSRKKLTPVFHLQTESEDDKKLSKLLLRNTRKTGQLNLSNRSLRKVPSGLWTLSEPDKEDPIDYNIAASKDQAWWNDKPLINLDLSSNCLTEIPPNIAIFEELINFCLHDNNLTMLPDEFSKLTKLTKLNLNHNKLTEIPSAVLQLTELRTLLINNNKIEFVSEGLTDLVMLQQLDLSHNVITKLPIGLGYLVRVTDLNLSHNKLIELPPDIVNMRELKKLDVIHNELVKLPKLGEMRKLEILYATHNNIEEIPDCNGCEKLQELYFGNNYIDEITPEFCETMPHLKILDLRDNKINTLPDEISNLQHLIRLDVTNNSLTNLPNSLYLLAHLQSLQLEGNQIRLIRRDILQSGTLRILKFLRERFQAENLETTPPKSTKTVIPIHKFPDKHKMQNCKTLNITMQELTSIPDDVFIEAKAAETAVIDLCKNRLQDVPEGLFFLNEVATQINLSFNLLKTIPGHFSIFRYLQYLNLENNLLTDIPKSLGKLRQLRELLLSNNKLTIIPECVYEMENLEILLANDNKITKISVEDLKNNKKLTVLYLANNNIDYIPPELGNLTNIRSLEITGNSFRQPRYAILAKGTDAILAYLRDKIPQPSSKK